MFKLQFRGIYLSYHIILSSPKMGGTSFVWSSLFTSPRKAWIISHPYSACWKHALNTPSCASLTTMSSRYHWYWEPVFKQLEGLLWLQSNADFDGQGHVPGKALIISQPLPPDLFDWYGVVQALETTLVETYPRATKMKLIKTQP